jgi:predicted transposase YbfD/YdcC
VEIRSLWVKKWAAEYVREQLGVPGCRSLIRLDKEIRCEGKEPILETRYFMSSLDPDKVSASEFQDLILGHWEVENCLHGQKDRFYDEDKHVLGRDSWGKAWTVLTNMALSLGQLLWRGERTKKEIRERCYINPMPIARKLGLVRETC